MGLGVKIKSRRCLNFNKKSLKLLDYIFYRIYRFYRGDPVEKFYPLYGLTVILLSSITVLVISIELVIGRKLIDLSGEPLLVVIIFSGSIIFCFLFFYLLFYKSGRSETLYFQEKRKAKIIRGIAIATGVICLFITALVLFKIHWDRLE